MRARLDTVNDHDGDVETPYSEYDMDDHDAPLLEPTTDELAATGPAINRKRVYVILFSICIAFQLALQILGPSQIPLFESIYCREWFQQHDPNRLPPDGGAIDEMLCKIPAVQQRVSTLRADLQVFEAVPSLLLAIPFGMLADTFGRKRLFAFSVTISMLKEFWICFVLAFTGAIPLNAVYLQAALSMLCGGFIVAELLFCVIITDVTPPQELSSKFFQFSAAVAGTRILGPFIAGGLMRLTPWVPITVGLSLLVIGSILSLTIPETIQQVKAVSDPVSIGHGSRGGSHRKEPIATRCKDAVMSLPKALKELATIWKDWRLVFLAAIYPVRMLLNATGDLLPRYMSNRYEWTLANATLVASLQALASTLVLLFLLPRVASFLEHKYGFDALQKDVLIARVSFGIVAACHLIAGLAPMSGILIAGLLLETLGSGAGPCLRAIVGSLISPEDNGRVFSGMAISEALSSAFAFKISAVLFNIGLEKPEKSWLGLPYDVTAGAFAFILLAMCLLRFQKKLEI